jgi:hypothetical protein
MTGKYLLDLSSKKGRKQCGKNTCGDVIKLFFVVAYTAGK